ncbi:MAG: hypothetical protein WA081_19550 [Desulfosalsimonadaceae bacterium]
MMIKTKKKIMLDPSEKNFYFMASWRLAIAGCNKGNVGSARDPNIALFFIGKPQFIAPTEKAKAP